MGQGTKALADNQSLTPRNDPIVFRFVLVYALDSAPEAKEVPGLGRQWFLSYLDS